MDKRAEQHLTIAQGLTEEIAHHIALALEIERVAAENKKASRSGSREPDPLASAVCDTEGGKRSQKPPSGEDTQTGEVVWLFD